MTKLAFASLGDFLQSIGKHQNTTNDEVGIFLSHWWLSHYINSWNSQDQYLQSQEPLCIFGHQSFRSRLGLRYRRIALNQSLEPSLESLTLEDNGFANCSNTLSQRLLPELLTQLKANADWDELRVSAVNEFMAKELLDWARNNRLIAYEYACGETFWVDFATLNRQDAEPFLNSRSANCRQQLRRAKRQIEDQFGELSIQNATSIVEANQWLDELGRLHQLRWPSQNPLEGFNNPFFTAFFHNIIQDGLSSGKVQVLKIAAGEKLIGYLFNLVKDGRVSFLMGGIDYHETDKFKPGMLCHWLAIEKNFVSGMQIYDFLNGVNRYKESLSTNRAVTKTITVAKQRFGLRLEHFIRQRRRLRNRNT
jgi:Acetyltransferase (GNAT) domain